MWTMTPSGFTSAVEHREDPSLLVVRSRDQASLLQLASDLGHQSESEVTKFPSDYPFRIVATKAEYAKWTHDQVLAIDYDNFKSKAARVRGGIYVEFLHRVWSAGLSLTDAQTREANDSAWDERDRDWEQS